MCLIRDYCLKELMSKRNNLKILKTLTLSGLVLLLKKNVDIIFFFFFGCAVWYVGSYFHDQGLDPCLLQWKQGASITGLLGKSPDVVLHFCSLQIIISPDYNILRNISLIVWSIVDRRLKLPECDFQVL